MISIAATCDFALEGTALFEQQQRCGDDRAGEERPHCNNLLPTVYFDNSRDGHDISPRRRYASDPISDN